MSITDNAFSRLGLETKLVFAEDEIQQAYRTAAAAAHPDAGGSNEDFDLVHNAHAKLTSPSKRLVHWLELHGISFNSRGALDAPLMDLFCRIGAVSQSAEALIKRRDAAQSALTRALLEAETQTCRDLLSQAISLVRDAIQNECASFPNLQSADPIPAESGCRCARNLAFLEKWQLSLRSLFAKLV